MNDDELLKLLVVTIPAATGFLGFMGGRFIKGLDYRDERKRLRNALYAELGANLQTLLSYQVDLAERVRGRPARVPPIDNWVRKEVYNEGLAKRPAMLRDLKEAKVFDDFYFALATGIQTPNDAEQRVALQTLMSWLHAMVHDNTLSRRRMYKVVGRLSGDFRPPIQILLTRLFSNLISRNLRLAPDECATYMYPKTISEIARAIWKGLPSRSITIMKTKLASSDRET